MSDFFSGIHGARFPEVAMNTGPLPPAEGLPAPLHDTPDGRINYGSTLLGDLSPYAYGEPGTSSSQQGYQNHPHRIQKFIPMIWLPEPAGDECFPLSHPVDDSDVAFCIKLDKRSIFTASGQRAGIARNADTVDTFINLSTLNYILAGLQIGVRVRSESATYANRWVQLRAALDPTFAEAESTPLTFSDIVRIVRDRVVPFGIVRGSERQGGQNETGSAPATWPVGFVAAMVIDGKDRNLNNYWHDAPISAGDDLVFRFDARPLKECSKYTLNHYFKQMQRRSFDSVLASPIFHGDRPTHVWQLIPDKFTLNGLKGKVTINERIPLASGDLEGPSAPSAKAKIMPGDSARWKPDVAEAIDHIYWQHAGYWHIARAQIQIGAYGIADYYFNDTSHAMYVNHLEITFAPTWCALPGLKDPRAKVTTAAADDATRTAASRRAAASRKGVVLLSCDYLGTARLTDHPRLDAAAGGRAHRTGLLEKAFEKASAKAPESTEADTRKRTRETEVKFALDPPPPRARVAAEVAPEATPMSGITDSAPEAAPGSDAAQGGGIRVRPTNGLVKHQRREGGHGGRAEREPDK